ncbi:hypothetical protein Pme01_22010 [Planosporangium mesophilum]|uniref:Imm33-like domain-containing protein n=2 Tax=Planosporangium mesophilum TaxID=689768 RepID=A0A8J3TD33_9ACTN|nr:hypothetical protein [Planosporangium mesophilum]GII22604.1 hypothetical protein Pme01_22010 [Planosporangium mesophilum]
MVGVSRSILQRPAAVSWPLHGLRHPPEGQGDGWYLWTGDLSEAVDFFVPNHVEHVISEWPEVAPYLGLPPGWRVLLAPGYEDIWFDSALLDISDSR